MFNLFCFDPYIVSRGTFQNLGPVPGEGADSELVFKIRSDFLDSEWAIGSEFFNLE